jgi:hypothetical protein
VRGAGWKEAGQAAGVHGLEPLLRSESPFELTGAIGGGDEAPRGRPRWIGKGRLDGVDTPDPVPGNRLETGFWRAA